MAGQFGLTDYPSPPGLDLLAGLDRTAALDMVAGFTHRADAALVDDDCDCTVVADFESADDYLACAAEPDHQALIADVHKPSVTGRAAGQL